MSSLCENMLFLCFAICSFVWNSFIWPGSLPHTHTHTLKHADYFECRYYQVFVNCSLVRPFFRFIDLIRLLHLNLPMSFYHCLICTPQINTTYYYYYVCECTCAFDSFDLCSLYRDWSTQREWVSERLKQKKSTQYLWQKLFQSQKYMKLFHHTLSHRWCTILVKRTGRELNISKRNETK